MIINTGKHRPQGPWDPNEKKYLNTSEAWLWLPLLGLVGAVIQALRLTARASRPMPDARTTGSQGVPNPGAPNPAPTGGDTTRPRPS